MRITKNQFTETIRKYKGILTEKEINEIWDKFKNKNITIFEAILKHKNKKTIRAAKYIDGCYMDIPNPREDDNLSVMLCSHKRYNLGDGEPPNINQCSDWDEVETEIRKEYNIAIIKPLYLFDHSGLSINTVGFGGVYGRFDSGQVGFVFITEEKIKQEGISKKKAEEMLNWEVEEYNKYLSGDIVTVEYLTINKDGEETETEYFYALPEKLKDLSYEEYTEI